MIDYSGDPDERHAFGWMRELGSIPVYGPPLPDAQVMWWKGQALRRIDAERRITRAMDTAEDIQVLTGLVGAAAFIALMLNLVADAVRSPVVLVSIGISVILLTVAIVAAVWSRREANAR